MRYLSGNEAEKVKTKMKSWLNDNYSNNEEISAIGTGGSINKLYNLSKHNFGEPMSYKV